MGFSIHQFTSAGIVYSYFSFHLCLRVKLQPQIHMYIMFSMRAELGHVGLNRHVPHIERTHALFSRYQHINLHPCCGFSFLMELNI